MRRKRAPGSQGASAEARAKVAHKKEGDFSSDGPSRKIVHKSILDWDLLNKPDSVMGQSFTFVTVMYIFTISSYVYWLMINKMSSFTNVVFRTVVNGEFFEVILLDMLMCVTCFVSFLIIKLAQKKVLAVNRANYAYILWMVSWTYYFISEAYSYEWSWSRYAFFSPHLFTMLMKQHAYYVTNIKMIKRGPTPAERGRTEGGDPVKFPNNITVSNYINFLLRPVFVYKLNYPKSESVRPVYLAWKTFTLVVSITVLYTIIEYVISPLFNMSNNLPLLGGTLLLSVPVVLCHMLLFYIMFEILTNILAEVTRHADRDFYGVWWGSGDFREFCRNWNKPVNGFLNTYIYKELRSKDLGFSFSLAITFLVSAICHEIIMFTVCRSLSPYIFTTMMLLVPVLMLENSRLLPAPYLVTLFRYWILFFSIFKKIKVASPDMFELGSSRGLYPSSPALSPNVNPRSDFKRTKRRNQA